jgi:hypothetical protein
LTISVPLAVKISTFFVSQMPKSKSILEFLSQSAPKVQENKKIWINVNFSKIESTMSVDVSLR